MAQRTYEPIWRSLRDGFPNVRSITIECHAANYKKIYKGVKKERWLDQSWQYRDHYCLQHEVIETSGAMVKLRISLVAWRKREMISALIQDTKR
jgi:hypothetical protein